MHWIVFGTKKDRGFTFGIISFYFLLVFKLINIVLNVSTMNTDNCYCVCNIFLVTFLKSPNGRFMLIIQGKVLTFVFIIITILEVAKLTQIRTFP